MMNEKIRRNMAAFVVTALVITGPFSMTASAQKPEDKGSRGKSETKVENLVEQEAEGETEAEIEVKKPWQAAKDALIAQKDEMETQKDQIEAEKEALETQAEEAKAAGNIELYQQVIAQIETLKADMNAKKEEMKAVKVQMKEIVRNRYSLEELDQLNKIAQEIQEQNEDVTVIPVENIITKKMNIKFDTPPVIKQDRTLIPVRALTEGFGATVAWNGEEKIVTVSKGDVEIIFQLNDGKVFVNGQETVIDVPAQLMSNRTIVPLRFIVEHLGLKVDYDTETGTIEIDDEEEVTDEEEAIEEEEVTDEEDAVVDEEEAVVEEEENTDEEDTDVVIEDGEGSDEEVEASDTEQADNEDTSEDDPVTEDSQETN